LKRLKPPPGWQSSSLSATCFLLRRWVGKRETPPTMKRIFRILVVTIALVSAPLCLSQTLRWEVTLPEINSLNFDEAGAVYLDGSGGSVWRYFGAKTHIVWISSSGAVLYNKQFDYYVNVVRVSRSEIALQVFSDAGEQASTLVRVRTDRSESKRDLANNERLIHFSGALLQSINDTKGFFSYTAAKKSNGTVVVRRYTN
jgi:hypothetical protein